MKTVKEVKEFLQSEIDKLTKEIDSRNKIPTNVLNYILTERATYNTILAKIK